jgi:2-(1,2-epoxy-1,2-dihydrophenyl)acetyl-CoA isomerase
MDFINYKKEGTVAWLKLNRPAVFNSFHRGMALELLSVLNEIEKDTAVRCIVITGEGKAFCAGQDLQEAMDPNGPGLHKILLEHYNPIIQKIRTIEKAFSKIGLIPDSGGTYFLPRLIGHNRASALMMTGDKVSASDALQMGMIYKVFPAEHFGEEIEKLANHLSQMPTKALVLTKQLLNESLNNDLKHQLEAELKYQLMASKTYDYNEGVSAFLEKRKPEFKGE